MKGTGWFKRKKKTPLNRPKPAVPVLRGWPRRLGIVLWLGVAIVPVLSYQLVNWTTPQPNYSLVLLIAVLLCTVNVLTRRPFWFSAATYIGVGTAVTIWQSLIFYQAPQEYNFWQSIGYAGDEWARAILRGTPSENTIYFLLLLIALTWIWGYFGTWRFLRQKNIWPSLFFGLIIVLVNLHFLNRSYYGYFYLYLTVSFILAGYQHFTRHNFHEGIFIRLSPRVLNWILVVIVGFSGTLALLSWALPEIKSARIRDYLELKVQTNSVIEKLDLNIFNAVSSKDTVVRSSEKNDLRFTSHPDLSEDVQFRITSSGVPNYWRIRRYDVYNQWGWSTSPYTETTLEAGELQPVDESAAEKTTLNYTVTNKIKTDIVISSGKHLNTDTSTIVAHFETRESDPDYTLNDSIVAVSLPHIYAVDESYNVEAQIIKPTVEQLRSSAESYPLAIVQQYVQLPSQFPFAIARLSSTVTRDATNKYDKVQAIIDYLKKYKYVQEGTYPPENKDGVSDFLFVRGSGNCTNFASAAVVMFRSIGIPARLCIGYIPHYVDQNSRTFILLARDYHAWAEVYFADYGWIEFEVTPTTTVSATAQSSRTNSVSGLSNANFNDFPPYYFTYPNSGAVPPGGIQTPRATQVASRKPVIPLFVLVLLAVLAAAGLVWYFRMKRRDAISSAMARLYFFSPLVGVHFQNSRTLEEYADKLSAKIPRQRRQIEGLTRIFAASRYSREKTTRPQDARLIHGYWRSIFWGILKRSIIRK